MSDPTADNDGPPLTVVHVSTQMTWRGGEGQADLLVRGLAARGHRCVVAARDGGEFARRLADAGIDVRTYRGKARSLRSLWGIRRVLRDVAPDIVHFHDTHALTSGGIAALALPVVRVYTRRVDFAIRSGWRYRRLCDVVVAISAAVEDVCRQGGIEDAQLRRVYSGVDPARVDGGDRARGRSTLELEEDDILLLCVAALTDHKGHRWLLEALPDVLQQQPRLVVGLAGDGELREELEAQSRRLQIDSRVRFLGYRDDVPDLLRAADLFVLPSHLEGLGTTLMDAMLAGVPIVCTTAGGMKEVVGADGSLDEPVAWTCPPRDAEALQQALLSALQAEDVRHGRVRRARRRAERLFTADAMVEGNLRVYRELLKRR
jgi:glycosyltransferase involved in cell wall biosynthesis